MATPRQIVRTLLATCLVGCAASIGCGGNGSNGGGSSTADNKIRVSYIGLTCEGPLIAAHELGFFKEEGLESEMTKYDWDSMRDALALGRADVTHHLTLFLLKPIEQGMDFYLTGGIHSGCLRLQAGINTKIENVADLKGKRVAINVMGNPPYMFSNRVFIKEGMDIQKDVSWIRYDNSEMELALDKGDIDAVASAEPIGTILLSRNKVRNIADQATDAPWKDEYCCVTVVNGKLARENPEKAAKATRAMMKGALWVQHNQRAMAKMAVEKGYVGASVEINEQAISKLNYYPAVLPARGDLLKAAIDMKKGGILNASTEPEELVNKAWLQLPGVTDEWIKTVKVEKLADGRPRPLSLGQFAALFNDPRMCREFRFCDDCSW
jgi:NitT/TauT family transport system substrate-binding protein